MFFRNKHRKKVYAEVDPSEDEDEKQFSGKEFKKRERRRKCAHCIGEVVTCPWSAGKSVIHRFSKTKVGRMVTHQWGKFRKTKVGRAFRAFARAILALKNFAKRHTMALWKRLSKAAAGLSKALSKFKKALRVSRAKSKVREEEMKDFMHFVKTSSRTGYSLALYNINKIAKEKREARLKAEREAARRRKIAKMIARMKKRLMRKIAQDIVSKGLKEREWRGCGKHVCWPRARQRILREREMARRKADAAQVKYDAVWSSLFCIIQHVQNVATVRRASCIKIQCVYRVLMARREALIKELMHNARVFRRGKKFISSIWKRRIRRAVECLVKNAQTKEEKERACAVLRRISTTAEYSRRPATAPVKPTFASIDMFESPFSGHAALALPVRDVTREVQTASAHPKAFGDDSYLKWIKIPVGVEKRKTPIRRRRPMTTGSSTGSWETVWERPPSRSLDTKISDTPLPPETRNAMKLRAQTAPHRRTQWSHYETLFKFIPAAMLGLDLTTSKGRRRAEITLENLAAANYTPKPLIDPRVENCPLDADQQAFYQSEKESLWDDSGVL